MPRLLHLSDLHLESDDESQAVILDRLVDALRAERSAVSAHDDRMTIVVTGDVFDTATAPFAVIDAFLRLHDRILDAVGKESPTVLVPGNHDRRRSGVFGPNRESLFRSLAEAAKGRSIHVAGTRTPFLAQVVPREVHRLPAHVIAYDSTYLARGFISAGGTIRIEDMLQVHAQLPEDGLPLIVLIHHHLVPTPVTDISRVESARSSWITRWLLGTALPQLIAHADREELTMTALGAGTALSTLHTFGRAVLLLHGHKHVPTARLVRAMTDGGGDVLLASAGSAGRRQELYPTAGRGAARLWPSFNIVEWTGPQVRIQSVSFAPKSAGRRPSRRTLADVTGSGPKWEPQAVSFRIDDVESRIDVDEARFRLSPSGDTWDLVCERRVIVKRGKSLRRYIDFVRVAPGVGRRRQMRVQLAIGETTRYEVRAGLCRTLDEGRRRYGPGTAFEWVGLLCRYGARQAQLELVRPEAEDLQPFASITDLTIGRERPAALTDEGDRWRVRCEACQPRCLLRIYWPLPESGPRR